MCSLPFLIRFLKAGTLLYSIIRPLLYINFPFFFITSFSFCFSLPLLFPSEIYISFYLFLHFFLYIFISLFLSHSLFLFLFFYPFLYFYFSFFIPLNFFLFLALLHWLGVNDETYVRSIACFQAVSTLWNIKRTCIRTYLKSRYACKCSRETTVYTRIQRHVKQAKAREREINKRGTAAFVFQKEEKDESKVRVCIERQEKL